MTPGGAGLTLRLGTDADAAGCLAIYGPIVRETPVSFETEPPDLDEMRRRIRQVLTGYPWLVAAAAGRLAGYAYGSVFRTRAAYRWTVETTVYVDRAARGRGVGRRLYRTLLEALALQGFRTAVGGIAVPNPASVRLHATLGFERVGLFRRAGFKLGRWHDMEWWAADLGGADPPGEVRPLAALVDDPRWAALGLG